MPSISLHRWRTTRIAALDQLEAAHRSVGGAAPGRRYATEQINQAYAILLSSQFQGYCRDLHSESAVFFVQGITPAILRTACHTALVLNRRLDMGNPNPGNLGADFNRFGLVFWDDVRTLDGRNQGRQSRLEELNLWRNAIAHQDFRATALAATPLRLQAIRRWRRACDRLASAFDEVMRLHLQSVAGVSPW